MAFLAVFFACFRSWILITGPTLLKIRQEKLILNWDSLIINFSFVWMFKINCCAWNSIIAPSDSKESIQRPSCDAIPKTNCLCNCDIAFAVSIPLFRIKAITTGGNAGNGICFTIKYIN